MATTKTTKKNTLPKIAKKWYEDPIIDPKTLRIVEFDWRLASGTKYVHLYDSPTKSLEDKLRLNLRSYITSYYFVLDKRNKRIFLYPIQLTGHQTRSSCVNARYEALNVNIFYMIDKNKQIWEIPKKPYQRYLGYDWNTRTSRYEDVEAEPRKVSRLSTYYYKVQCQSTTYIREIFSELFGDDFVYQNKLITDSDIRNNNWTWIGWLQTKGRKYSDKTIKNTDELMNKISSQSRWFNEAKEADQYCSTSVKIETINGITLISYYSNKRETFRQIYNAKTCKMDNYIWKNDKWTKSGKLSDWQQISEVILDPSYKEANEYDYKFLNEAQQYYENAQDSHRRYWYSPGKNLYNTIMFYIAHPVVHQLLQIQDSGSRRKMYDNNCDISKIYGKIPNKGKTMFAKLGVNKYQFAHPETIVYMKWLLETNNISHIDNDTWDRCTEAFTDVNRDFRDHEIRNFLVSHGEFSIDRWINIYKLEQYDREQYRGAYYNGGVKQLYSDYYRSLSAMSEFGIDISGYPLIFNNKQQLQRYHDEAARAVSSIRNRAQDEKFMMLYNKREKMLENDGVHMITMPKCSSDLVEEGSYLHHCVGGYASSVANGSTAIYFLRQSSAPDTPWLTVEVRNKMCHQIHGACNAWMGSKDEYFDAVPFLVWWFEKHDIQYSENLLTNMATGYGSISQRRVLPTAKIEAYKATHKNKK